MSELERNPERENRSFVEELKRLMELHKEVDRKVKMDALDAEYEILSEEQPTLSEALQNLFVEYYHASPEEVGQARKDMELAFANWDASE